MALTAREQGTGNKPSLRKIVRKLYDKEFNTVAPAMC
jgi:hypothetical protein